MFIEHLRSCAVENTVALTCGLSFTVDLQRGRKTAEGGVRAGWQGGLCVHQQGPRGQQQGTRRGGVRAPRGGRPGHIHAQQPDVHGQGHQVSRPPDGRGHVSRL